MDSISEKTRQCMEYAYQSTMLQYSGDTRKKLVGSILSGIVSSNTYFTCTKSNIMSLSEYVFSDPVFRDFLLNLTTRFFFHYGSEKPYLVEHLAQSLFINPDTLVPLEIATRLPDYTFIQETLNNNRWLCAFMVLTMHCDICISHETNKLMT